MDNLSLKHKNTTKFIISEKNDIYDAIINKTKQFYEGVHPPEVSNRIFFKHSEFKNLILESKNIEAFNDEDAIAFLDYEENRTFIEFNENLFNFNSLKEQEMLISLDLLSSDPTQSIENQNILDKSNSENNLSYEDDKDKKENIESKTKPDGIAGSNDLIAINYFPISISHTSLAINYDKNFSQILSNELINHGLEIFNFTKNSSLRIGFDSLGAGCFINHLHFELIWLDDLNIKNLAIENCDTNVLFKTNLVHKDLNESEINIFNSDVLVSVEILKDYNLNAWKLCSSKEVLNVPDNELKISHIASMSFITDSIISILIEKELPYNIIIGDKCTSVYIIPRKFGDNKKQGFNSSWLDLSGLPLINSKELISKLESEGDNYLNNLITKNISIENSLFESLSKTILDKFNKQYKLK